MIASENHAPLAVLQAQGSVLTNKYAEGYPGRRYYGGCEHVDEIERLAIERIKALFGAGFANVQPHSGAQANAAAMHALIKPGDTILGLSLAHGGHLTHGMRINFSGLLYNVVAYEVDPDTMRVDLDQVARLAAEHRPKLIIAGWSAYPRQLDFARFRQIADEVGAYLLVDMAHFAGLVAAGLHPSPVPHAHVTTSTTHKTLGGPRGGFILTNDPELAKKVNSAVFPGQQGGPLEHVIAAKATAFKMAAEPEFVDRQRRTLEGSKILAERLSRPDVAEGGISVLTGGTDVHLVLVNLGAARAGREAGRGPAGRGGHHGEPQRGPVRPAAADGHLRAAHRHRGAGHPRLPDRGVRRGGRRHREHAAAAGERGRRPGPGGGGQAARPGRRAGRPAPALPRPRLLRGHAADPPLVGVFPGAQR